MLSIVSELTPYLSRLRSFAAPIVSYPITVSRY
nr:MAG TPA: hypothetical protein [Caudoviricetes sp.]